MNHNVNISSSMVIIFLLPIVCKETHLIISLKTIFLALFVCSKDDDSFQFTGTKGMRYEASSKGTWNGYKFAIVINLFWDFVDLWQINSIEVNFNFTKLYCIFILNFQKNKFSIFQRLLGIQLFNLRPCVFKKLQKIKTKWF